MVKWIKKLFGLCEHDYRYDMKADKVVHEGKLMFKFGEIKKVCRKCQSCEVVCNDRG